MSLVVPCLYIPAIVTAGSMILRLTRTPDATGVPATTSTTISTGSYSIHRSTGSLAAQLALDFGTVNGVTVVATVTSDTGICTITVSGLDGGTNCSIDWTFSSAAAALGTALGFATTIASSATAAAGAGPQNAVFTGTKQIYGFWTPDIPPVFDEDDDERDVVVGESQGGYNTYDRLFQKFGRVIEFQFVAAAKIKVSFETTENTSLERLFRDASGPGLFRYWTDRDTLGSGYDDYYLTAENLERFSLRPLSHAVPLYGFTLRMREAP